MIGVTRMETSKLISIWSLFLVALLRWTPHLSSVEAQQTYKENKQLNCDNDLNYTDGYTCNGVESSCQAYLTFRSNTPFNSPADIGLLLGSEPTLIAEANNISNFEIISTDTQILIPVNCSCSRPYYQHKTSYRSSSRSETYFTVANNTYQGLTTCHALMAQKPYVDSNLTVGQNLEVPLRCACPTSNQSVAGVKYLLTYMVTSDDSLSSIAQLFGVEQQSILLANELFLNSTIFPFTPILVPFNSKPSRIQRASSPPLLSPPQSPNQTYVANKQLDCKNKVSYTYGYTCNDVKSSCQAYLTFRSIPPYNSPAAIGLLLGSEPSLIAEANNISNFATISTDTQILIPVNCSCSGHYYQYNTSYKLSSSETYFTVSNNTYQGLTTCQAMMAQNPYGEFELPTGINLNVPLRCACPTSNQTAAGVNYLITYMVTQGDSIHAITQLFGVEQQSILDANQLSGDSLIFPFTPILIPLKGRPSIIRRVTTTSNRRPVFVGVDMGATSVTNIFCIGA
ncbi:uncharacterized protein LOC109007738 [Juglans regia]|uniref:Uncharacterized protein LOC109007738 n=1 Tax=Juglans regia TaxID=51240 RepID=A0A2I4GGR8_JUGRE|nr:uncharacterized protein LOC109007738 [Juglans regia]